MKKLLLTSAVLVGMGVSQAFAAATDEWTTEVNLTTSGACKLSAAEVIVSTAAGNLTGTNNALIAGAAPANIIPTFSLLANDADNLLTSPVVTEILFDGQSYCNASHSFTFKSQFNGYASQEAATAANIGTGSDDFLTGIPYSTMVITGWEDDVDGLSWTAGAVDAYVAAPADTAAWDTVSNEVEDLTVVAWHNDGDRGTEPGGAGATGDGLRIVLTHTPTVGTTDILPMLKGTYTDRYYLKIATTL